VLSRTTASRYRETKSSLPEIAQALGVRWVVEGGVGLEGDHAYVKLRTVDASTDRKVWADVYDCNSREIVAVSTRAAGSIASAIDAKLRARE
jgi:TolB-like protein